MMRYHSLSFPFILCSISFARSSPDNYDFFGFDNLEDPFFSDISDFSNSAPDPWGLSNEEEIFNQNQDNANLDMFAQVPEDETVPDFFATGCPATDGLATRDSKKCPNPTEQIKVPEFPDLDMMEQIAPSTPQNQGLGRSEDTSLTVPNNNGICPPLKSIHLCCLCEAKFQFTYCQDCLPSKPFLITHPCQHSDGERLPRKIFRDEKPSDKSPHFFHH